MNTTISALPRVALGALVALALLAPRAHAAAEAPAQIPIQGFLADDAGVPVDASPSFLFALYNAETGGAPIYTETQSVLVEGGFFTAYLGDGSALDLAIFRDNSPLYLGVSIDGGSEMSPRTQFATVPYAAYAEYAGSVLTGGAAAGTYRVSGVAPTNSPATLETFVVRAPGPGSLTVMVTGSAWVDCDSTTTSSKVCSGALVGICDAAAVLSTAQCGTSGMAVWHEDPDNVSRSNAQHLITFVRTIPVAAAGNVQIWVNGQGPESSMQLRLTGYVNVIYTPGDALTITAPRVGGGPRI
ncbi:MAG: hypothetical protein GXP55_24120 [Deltaproteobacteria bacterium]|nr:hypothetical protein [Deltaproteobacteria bacterium]